MISVISKVTSDGDIIYAEGDLFRDIRDARDTFNGVQAGFYNLPYVWAPIGAPAFTRRYQHVRYPNVIAEVSMRVVPQQEV